MEGPASDGVASVVRRVLRVVGVLMETSAGAGSEVSGFWAASAAAARSSARRRISPALIPRD